MGAAESIRRGAERLRLGQQERPGDDRLDLAELAAEDRLVGHGPPSPALSSRCFTAQPRVRPPNFLSRPGAWMRFAHACISRSHAEGKYTVVSSVSAMVICPSMAIAA